MKLQQVKDQAVRWLLGQNGVREVERSFGGAATVKLKETPLERLNAYRKNVQQLHQTLQEKLPAFGRDVEKQKLNNLKAELNRLRTELLADLEKPLVEALDSVLTDEQRKLGPLT